MSGRTRLPECLWQRVVVMRYLRELDGIRALAVLAVVGLHAQVPGFRGGGIGVDVFFALSGYLITSLLLREIQKTGRIARGRFYARRALRLLPALALTIVWTTILDLLAKRGGGHMGEAAPAAAFYYANWLVAHNDQALGFLGQTWSLAIEEQFYILWPLLLLIPTVRRHLRGGAILFVFATIVWRIAAYKAVGFGVLDWTPARADELAIGAWLAARQLDPKPLPGWVTSLPATLLSGLVLAALVLVGPHLPKWSGVAGEYDVAAAASVIVIAHCASERSFVTRILGSRPLVAVGRVSYGVYLYHYAILLFLFADGYGRAEVWAIAFPVMIVLTVASWFLIEKPAQRFKVRYATDPVEHPEPALAPI